MGKKYFACFQLIIIFLILSCSNKYKIKVNPDDAMIIVNGTQLSNNSLYVSKLNNIEIICQRNGYKEYKSTFLKKNIFGIKKIDIQMEKEKYNLKILTLDQITSEVYLDSKKIGTTPFSIEMEYGNYELILKRNDYADQKVILEARRNGEIVFSHKKNAIPIKQIGIFKCGMQPKQIIYSPEDKYIFMPLLAGDGFQIFDNDTFQMKSYIIAPEKIKNKGFPEGLFIKDKNVFLVSQMTTGNIYEYSYPQMKYIRTLQSKGIWSKFMAYSKKSDALAISNWASNDVSIIDYSTGEVIKKISTAPSPRGLIFTNDGNYLFITSYDGGTVYKVKTEDWIIEKTIYKQGAAMRHIVLNRDNSIAYVSDMNYNVVYEIDVKNFQIINTFNVDYNPNTIDITPDNKFLFVSCRGPNDSETYLKRSPRNGNIEIIDLENKKISAIIEGGNQPTGLDISNDGNYLCFSNFRDDNFEIYWIGDYNK